MVEKKKATTKARVTPPVAGSSRRVTKPKPAVARAGKKLAARKALAGANTDSRTAASRKPAPKPVPKPAPSAASRGRASARREKAKTATGGSARVPPSVSRRVASGPQREAPGAPRDASAAKREARGPRRGAPNTSRAAAPPRRRAQRTSAAAELGARQAASQLTEEERIESAKYDSFERRRRVFEEERFLFPESYGTDRVRLLVKDPEWLFAHWDVSPGALGKLRADLGERALALSRLTLKVEDPANGALSVVLLPEGARSWYVRTHLQHRTYRALLGVTTPSGEFRSLASSNVVVAPRVGPSPERATRRVSFRRASEARAAGAGQPAASARPPGKANPAASRTGVSYIDATAGDRPSGVSDLPERGGASDVFGPSGAGAGVEQGGASDVFRR